MTCRKREAQNPRRLAQEPKKKVKSGQALVERVPKAAPKAAVFCHLFTGTA